MSKVSSRASNRKPRAATERESLLLEWLRLTDALADLGDRIKAARATGAMCDCEANDALAALSVAGIELTDNRPRVTG